MSTNAKEIKIEFKNGKMSLATCCSVDLVTTITTAVTSKNWAKAFRDVATMDDKRSGLAFLLAAWTIKDVWKWITISKVAEDNVLELQYERAKESNFNKIVGKIKDEVNTRLEVLNDALDDVLEEGDAECKEKIQKILNKVTVDSVEMVGQESQERAAAAMFLDGVGDVTAIDKDVTLNISAPDKPGIVADKMIRNAENITLTTIGGTKDIGGEHSGIEVEGSACDGKKTVCATYLDNVKNALVQETGAQNQVVGARGTETSLTKVEEGRQVTVKKENVCEKIKGEGSNSTTAGSIVEGTQTFTEIREGGKTHVDSTNAGGDSLTAGVVTRNGANAVLKFKNHSMTING